MKNQKITEDHFKQPGHYTKLKEKIKICVAGVLFNIPLRRDNKPGNIIMSWFNDLTKEDKKKVVLDEVFLVRREPVGTEYFPDDPKSPEHKTSNIE